MLGQRHEIAWLQSDFYRQQFQRVLKWLVVLVFIMFILIGAIIYYVLYQPTVHYYANTTDGKILDMPTPRT